MPTKKDLVLIILNEYSDRIQPSIPSEVKDIAAATGFTPRQICDAMDQALDEMERIQMRYGADLTKKEIRARGGLWNLRVKGKKQ